MIQVGCTEHRKDSGVEELADEHDVSDVHHLIGFGGAPHVGNNQYHHLSDHCIQNDDQVLDPIVQELCFYEV